MQGFNGTNGIDGVPGPPGELVLFGVIDIYF